MDARVLLAADNNARWCDLVCRSHGIATATEHGMWTALDPALRLYPDVVTLRPEAAVEDVLISVRDRPECAVKDSFAVLALGERGFRELFDAQWIFRDPAPTSGSGALAWSAVETLQGLAEWTRTADLTDIIRAELLHDPSVCILAASRADGLVAGAVANRTGSVVGVSNVFATTVAAEEVWAGIADAVAGVFPSLPLTGYEHGDGLEAAGAGGFTAIGALRVWHRSSND